MRYPRFQYFQSCQIHLPLDFFFKAFCYLLAASAKRLFAFFFGSIVGIEPDDIARSRVALNREEFEIVVHIEYGFCGVDDSPYHHDADYYRIAQGVVDLLFLIVESHGFERYFFRSLFGGCTLSLVRRTTCVCLAYWNGDGSGCQL